MISFTRFLLLTSLFSSVFALPVASQVSQRDVVDPPVTSPDSTTVWHVGDTQTVTWSTIGLPVNQTNPVGTLVLGYQYNNSENLMLNSPLATNINYSVGHVQITVPNVPTRSDYIVVLFGDSGNASPEFTIINDSSSSTSAQAPSPVSTSSPDQSPTAGSTPASTPPSTSAGGSGGSNSDSSPSPSSGSPAGGLAATTTAPSSHTASSASSTTLTVTSSITPSSTQSSAAWQKHVPGLSLTSLSVALTLIYFSFS